LLWIISGDGVSQLSPAIVTFFSGMVIPLPLSPDWAQPLFYLLPFRGIIDAPSRLYMGHIPPGEVWRVLLHQWVRLILLIAIGRWVLSKGTRRLVVQGGRGVGDGEINMPWIMPPSHQ
jgi:ABC-2 type transport system permease protein